jgi:hypothetical protein
MKKVVGIALLLMLATMTLGLAHAADPVVVEIPANDAVNGSVTVTVDENAGSATVYAEGAAANPDPLDGYAYADTNGTCWADDEGDYNDDSDGDGLPDNQTCEDAINGLIPA